MLESVIDVVIVDIYDLTVVRQVSKKCLAKEVEPTGWLRRQKPCLSLVVGWDGGSILVSWVR